MDNKNPKFIQLNNNRSDNDQQAFVDTMENCTFYGNAWGGDNVSERPSLPTPTEPTTPVPEPVIPIPAVPTASTILLNGVPTAFTAYNIGGNNYFKLRDLAYALNGTESSSV